MEDPLGGNLNAFFLECVQNVQSLDQTWLNVSDLKLCLYNQPQRKSFYIGELHLHFLIVIERITNDSSAKRTSSKTDFVWYVLIEPLA